MQRRDLIKGLLGAGIISSTRLAKASTYPNRPIKFFMPYQAGGVTDVLCRKMAIFIQNELGQPVIVENRPGATGVLATMQAAASKPDGYTIALASDTIFRFPLMQKTSFDPSKLTFISQLFDFNYSLVVRSDSPWETIDDFLASIKQEKKIINYGTPGLYTAPHFVLHELAKRYDQPWQHIPYNGGGAELVPALIGGHLDLIAGSLRIEDYVRQGKLRVLATMNAKRSVDYPDVPTFKERGLNLVAYAPAGVVAPRSLDSSITQTLEDVFRRALESAEVINQANDFGMELMYLNSKDYTAAAMKNIEHEKIRMREFVPV